MKSELWPRFELVTVGASAEVPRPLAERFATVGVPSRIISGEYMIIDPVFMIGADSDRPLACFARSSLLSRVCVDVVTGAVVEIANEQSDVRNPVNRNLDLFAECVKVAIQRFPYYGDGAELEEREAVAAQLGELLAAVDPTALEFHGFWPGFLDDLIDEFFDLQEVLREQE